MLKSVEDKTTSRKEYITKLYDILNNAVYGYNGVSVNNLNGAKNLCLIKVQKEQMDLKRFQKLGFESQYLFDSDTLQITKLTDVPVDTANSQLLYQTQSPHTGMTQVRFRKGENNDKDLYIEVWSGQERGFISSLKVNDKMSKIYNDTAFESASWSRDESKIAFIAEKADLTYKNHWEDSNPKTGANGQDQKEEEKTELLHYLDEKYVYTDDFGETLIGKKRPGLFIFDIKENTLKLVQGIDPFYPSQPIFTEDNKGLIFVGINTPIQKLGMNYCINRDQKLYHISEPIFEKKDLQDKENYLNCLTPDHFVSVHPRFSSDFAKLSFIGTRDKFLSHSPNYQFSYLPWPAREDMNSVLVIDQHPDYPKEDEEFCGIYALNIQLSKLEFLGYSNKFYVIESEIKGQSRTFITDIDKKEIKWLNFLNKDKANAFVGHYDLLKIHKNTITIKYSSIIQPPQIYLIYFKQVDRPDLTALLNTDNYTVTLLEEISFNASVEEQEIASVIKSFKKEVIRLENGAEGIFIRSQDLDKNKRHPMLVLPHSGPFCCLPQDIFTQFQTMVLLQGWTIMMPNYTGTTGYGLNFMNNLLGHIGDRDINDQGKLTRLALETFSDIVDPSRVSVYGGSHGGFSTAWLIGHPDYSKLWASAIECNGVINMSYMYSACDIPDWVWACCLNCEPKPYVSSDDNKIFFDMSPISVVKNVTTPTLVIVGEKDKRVPPHQSWQYYHILKESGVKCKLLNYPDDGHAITSNEPSVDVLIQMLFWLDEHFTQ